MRIWSRRLVWAPVWMARALWAVGVVSVVSALSPDMAWRLHEVTSVLPDAAPGAARAATVVLGVGAVLLAHGLRHRKRRAWQLAFATTVVVTALHLVKGLDVPEALLSAGVAGLLFSTRDAFPGEPDPRSWRQVLLTFLASSTVAVVVGTAILMLDTDSRPAGITLQSATGRAAVGIVGFSDSAPWTATLAVLGALVLVVTVLAMLRPAEGPHPLAPAEEERLRDLLARHGRHDSLGYFALRSDKSVLFAPSGKAAIGYRVVAGVSLASGDPVGDPEAWCQAIDAWLAECRRFAWVPAVLGAGERGAAAYTRAGLDALELGDEAVLTVSDFTLDGRAMRGVRQAVNRLTRLGYRADVVALADLGPAEVAELVAAADGWRDGAVERGFSMALGRLGVARDEGCVVARARDADGRLVAVLHLVPWGADGLSLDLMRRDPDADNGVVELLVTELMARAPRLGATGIARVSLNFAVFRAVFDRGARLGAGPVLRLWYAVLLRASTVWQLESLYRANAKYQPEWRPRFVCFPAARDLPAVLVAALRAESFLPQLRMPRRRTRPAVAAPDPVPADHLAAAPPGLAVSRGDTSVGVRG